MMLFKIVVVPCDSFPV